MFPAPCFCARNRAVPGITMNASAVTARPDRLNLIAFAANVYAARFSRHGCLHDFRHRRFLVAVFLCDRSASMHIAL